VGLLNRVGRPTTHVTLGKHRPENGSRESGSGRVDQPLAAAALDRGSPNVMGAIGVRVFVGQIGAGPGLG